MLHLTASETQHSQDMQNRLCALSYANGDVAKAREIYGFLTEGTAPPAAGMTTAPPAMPKEDKTKTEKPKADKSKTEKPAEPAKTETAKTETAKTDEPPALDYAADVQPKVLAIVARLQTAGLNPLEVLKPKLEAKYQVGHAKDVPADKWAEMLVYLETEATAAIKASAGVVA